MLIPHTLRAVALWLLSASLLAAAEPSGQPAPRQAAPWTCITYPGSIVPALGGDKMELTIEPEIWKKRSGLVERSSLRFQFVWIPRDAETTPFDEPGHWKVRLHYPDGRVLEPEFEALPGKVSMGIVMDIRWYTFPFSDNTLTNAWLEVRIDQNTYWYEIPYGFTRDPAAPVPPSDPKAAPAGYAPAMKDSPKDAQIVRWQFVRYDFGTIQNGWKLQADLTNDGERGCLLHLRRADGPWDFHAPVTKVKVEPETGVANAAEQSAERLSPHHPQEREDEFLFRFKPLSGRGWGTLTISVDDQSYPALISLGTFLPAIWNDPWAH